MKSIMKQAWLIVVLLAIASNLLSQAPGYLGKRTIIKYDLLFSPQLGYNGAQYSYGTDPIVPLNIKHVLNYDRVLSRVTTLGFEGGVRFTGYHATGFDQPNGNELQIAKVIAPTLGIHAKFHAFRTKGTLAPLGSYFELIARYGYAQGTLETIPDRPVRRMGQFVMPCFGFGLGNNLIVGNSVVIDFGMQFMICGAFETGLTGKESISDQIGVAMAAEEAVNFKIGIGFLSGKLKH